MINIILYIIRMRYIKKPVLKLLYKIFPKWTYKLLYKEDLCYSKLEKYYWIEDLCNWKIYFI